MVRRLDNLVTGLQVEQRAGERSVDLDLRHIIDQAGDVVGYVDRYGTSKNRCVAWILDDKRIGFRTAAGIVKRRYFRGYGEACRHIAHGLHASSRSA